MNHEISTTTGDSDSTIKSIPNGQVQGTRACFGQATCTTDRTIEYELGGTVAFDRCVIGQDQWCVDLIIQSGRSVVRGQIDFGSQASAG